MIRAVFVMAAVALVFGAVSTSQAALPPLGAAIDSGKVMKVYSQQRLAAKKKECYGCRCWWRGGVRVCK